MKFLFHYVLVSYKTPDWFTPASYKFFLTSWINDGLSFKCVPTVFQATSDHSTFSANHFTQAHEVKWIAARQSHASHALLCWRHASPRRWRHCRLAASRLANAIFHLSLTRCNQNCIRFPCSLPSVLMSFLGFKETQFSWADGRNLLFCFFWNHVLFLVITRTFSNDASQHGTPPRAEFRLELSCSVWKYLQYMN